MSYSDPFAVAAGQSGQRLYDQAGAKITIDASNNIVIKNFGGTTVNSSSGGNDKKLYTAIKAAITTNSSIQDGRGSHRPAR